MARRREQQAREADALATLRDRRRGTRQAFLFEGIAITVAPWREPGRPPERGARVEVQLLEDQPHRGSASAGQRIVIDTPRVRVDIFDETNGPPGNLRKAHLHPSFEGVEPCERVWVEQLREHPSEWLADALGDLPGLLQQSGGIPAVTTWLDADTTALRAAVPAIVAAVEDALRLVREEDPES